MTENCPRCRGSDVYEWGQAGAGIQIRCNPCNYFVAWKELPRTTAKKEPKKNGRKQAKESN